MILKPANLVFNFPDCYRDFVMNRASWRRDREVKDVLSRDAGNSGAVCKCLKVGLLLAKEIEEEIAICAFGRTAINCLLIATSFASSRVDAASVASPAKTPSRIPTMRRCTRSGASGSTTRPKLLRLMRWRVAPVVSFSICLVAI